MKSASKSPFPGFPPAALKFLRALKKNNNRDWFEANKAVYLESVKAPMEQLVTLVSAALTRFAPQYATEPKKALFRIYRDTRFSTDKTPYKTHIAAIFPRAELSKDSAAAFYFHLSPEHLGIAGGLYRPDPDQLRAVRTMLSDRHIEFVKLAKAKPVVALMGDLEGESVSRPPKGFAKDHPAIDLLRQKQWLYWKELDPKVAETPGVYTEIVTRFQKMAPLVEFLNAPLVGLARKNQRTRMDDGF